MLLIVAVAHNDHFWCDHFMSYRTRTLVPALAPKETIGASASSNGIVYFAEFCTNK